MLRKSQKIGRFGPFRCLAPRHAIQVFPILQEKGRQVDCNQVIRAKWSQKFQDSPKIYFYTSGMIAECPRTPMGYIPRDASGKKKPKKVLTFPIYPWPSQILGDVQDFLFLQVGKNAFSFFCSQRIFQLRETTTGNFGCASKIQRGKNIKPRHRRISVRQTNWHLSCTRGRLRVWPIRYYLTFYIAHFKCLCFVLENHEGLLPS